VEIAIVKPKEKIMIKTRMSLVRAQTAAKAVVVNSDAKFLQLPHRAMAKIV